MILEQPRCCTEHFHGCFHAGNSHTLEFFAVILIIHIETAAVPHGRQGRRACCTPGVWEQRLLTPALRPVI